jgi:hypothetical protein
MSIFMPVAQARQHTRGGASVQQLKKRQLTESTQSDAVPVILSHQLPLLLLPPVLPVLVPLPLIVAEIQSRWDCTFT